MLVYPNPVTDHLTIHFTDENVIPHKAILWIKDIPGHILHSSPITAAESRIEMEHYAKGVYFLHITAENENIATRKIVVQ